MLFNRTRTAPTGYEKVRWVFHGIRTAQLISSIIVGCIMSYFIYHLRHDHDAIPWTFSFLTASSILTVAVLTATIIFHCLAGLSPKLNLALNASILVLWALGFGMLSYWGSGTLGHHCDIVNWTDEVGVMVCRIYKALFTFALLGLLSTIAALCLDIHIYRLVIARGKHMRLDNLETKRRAPAVNGPYTDNDANDEQDLDSSPSRHSEAFEIPTREYGQQPDADVMMQGKGYAVPEGQFEYDTGYHGGHAERVFGSS